LVFLLRWFWWRVNAWSEITAMGAALTAAIYFNFIHPRLGGEPLPSWQILLSTVAFATASWITVTLSTAPADDSKLREFYRNVRPGGPGWAAVRRRAEQAGEPVAEAAEGWDVPIGLICAALGCIMVYSTLFATGKWIYGDFGSAIILTLLALAATTAVLKLWKRLRFQGESGR
jgi:hypothetical protein